MTLTATTKKEIKALATRRGRDRSGRFVAEGEDLLQAADEAGWTAVKRFVAGTNVEADALAKVSQLGSGTRALAIYEQRWADAIEPLAVALYGIADPGNVGTILRSALAFGARTVALGPGTADPYSPKSVRASMGAIFAVPVARFETLDELPGPRLALAARTGTPLDEVSEAGTILVGAERAGLPDDVLQHAEQTAHIPIETESLNAAMAATIALYSVTRIPRS